MNLDRRQFLAASAAFALAPRARPAPDCAPQEPLTYAPDADQAWRKLGFVDRLRKLNEAGYTRYEFGHWKTKDFGAILKYNEEAGTRASRFLAFAGIADPKRKDACLAAVEEAAEMATKMGATRLTIVAGSLLAKGDPDDQVGAAVDALRESVEKLGESGATLILDPFESTLARAKPLLATFAEAIEAIKEVDQKRARLLLDVDRLAPGDGKAMELIEKHAGLIGAYRVGPKLVEPALLRAIRQSGHAEPIGVALDPKGDPVAALNALRDADAASQRP